MPKTSTGNSLIRYFPMLMFAFALVLGGCSMAQDGAIMNANKAIAREQYGVALTHLSDAERYTPPTPATQAQISFLRGRSYEGLNRIPEAVGSYEYVVEKYHDSIYAYQAKERLKVLNPSGKYREPIHR